MMKSSEAPSVNLVNDSGKSEDFLPFWGRFQSVIAELFISPYEVLLKKDMQCMTEKFEALSLPEQQAFYDKLSLCFGALKEEPLPLRGSPLDEDLRGIEEQFALVDGNENLKTGYLKYWNPKTQGLLISKIHALLQAHYTDYFKKQFRALPRTEQMALFEIITSFQQQLQRESTVAVKGTLSDGIHRVIPLEGANWDYLVVDVQSVLNEDVLGSLIIFMGMVLGKY